MRFLVLGAGGMAGHTISIYLQEQGHEVTGFARRKLNYVKTIVGDATNYAFVQGIVCQGNFDVIVNAIGILNQDAEDRRSLAVMLNGYYPHFLAEITGDMDTQIIHISTDCVFSGKHGNYTEESIRDGETFYDRSKALGELEDKKNITFRNSIVGPDINTEGIGLFNWFMKQSDKIRGFTKVMWTGMTTPQLAKMIEKAALLHVTGLYNLVPDHNISKYELLRLFNQYFRENKIVIQPDESICSDKTLIRTHFEFSEIVPDYEVMVYEMAKWIKVHKHLYPHYNL